MATVYIRGRSERPDDLPDVCMKCGRDGKERVKKTFNWVPPWIGITILAGLLIYVILAMILKKTKTVSSPFCEEHRGHWRNRLLLNLGGFFVLVGGGIGLTVLVASAAGPNNDLGGLAVLFLVGGLVAWLAVLIATTVTSVRCQEITDDGIKLTGVSEGFVEAYHQMEDEERQARRAARGVGRQDERRRDEDEERPSRRGDRRIREEDDAPPPPRRRDERPRREDEDY